MKFICLLLIITGYWGEKKKEGKKKRFCKIEDEAFPSLWPQ